MQHISSRGTYLSSRKVAISVSLWVLTNPAAPPNFGMMLQYLSFFSLWLGPTFLFTLLFFVSLVNTSLWCGQYFWHFSALTLLSVLRHCLHFGLEFERVWPGKSRHCTCAGEGHCPVHAVWGRGAASSVCMRMIETSQTLSLALIGCVDPEAVDSCKSN